MTNDQPSGGVHRLDKLRSIAAATATAPLGVSVFTEEPSTSSEPGACIGSLLATSAAHDKGGENQTRTGDRDWDHGIEYEGEQEGEAIHQKCRQEQQQQPAQRNPDPVSNGLSSSNTTGAIPLISRVPREPIDFADIDIFEEDLGERLADALARSRWREEARKFKYGDEVVAAWKRGSTPEEARNAWKKKTEEQQRVGHALSDLDSDGPTDGLHNEQEHMVR